MQQLFWGMLFVFLDFSLTVHGHEIGLLPDFLGYALLLSGARRMRSSASGFLRLVSVSRSMLVFSASLYLLDLSGISQSLGAFGQFLSLFCTAAGLWAAFLLARAMMELQTLRGLPLHAEALSSAWATLALSQMISYLFLMNTRLSTLFSLICLGASLFYLYRFFCCLRACQQNQKQ